MRDPGRTSLSVLMDADAPRDRSRARRLRTKRQAQRRRRIMTLAVIVFAAMAVFATTTTRSALDDAFGQSASAAIVAEEKSVTEVTTQLCQGPPVTQQADRDLLFTRTTGEVRVNGHLVSDADGPDWIASYAPDRELAAKGIFRWTVSPFVSAGGGGASAYAAYSDAHGCHMANLSATPSDVMFDVGGAQVPATELSFVLPKGAVLDYVVINVNEVDPLAAV